MGTKRPSSSREPARQARDCDITARPETRLQEGLLSPVCPEPRGRGAATGHVPQERHWPPARTKPPETIKGSGSPGTVFPNQTRTRKRLSTCAGRWAAAARDPADRPGHGPRRHVLYAPSSSVVYKPCFSLHSCEQRRRDDPHGRGKACSGLFSEACELGPLSLCQLPAKRGSRSKRI